MSAYKEFKKTYSKKNIIEHYWSKIAFKRSIGLDRISNQHFSGILNEEVSIIHKKIFDGSYNFTHYKEFLISKGANKNPRVISIPTIRDQVTLSLCNELLKKVFNEIEFPLVQEIVDRIGKCIDSGVYDSYVKFDISHFYSSINHEVLNKKLHLKIHKKEILELINKAITNPTICPNSVIENKEPRTIGVPEGIAISNILANIYLGDLSTKIKENYDVEVFRYVDDILILCNSSERENVFSNVNHLLKTKYCLDSNDEKNSNDYLHNGVVYLGYEFYDYKITVSQKSKLRIENSLEELFRNAHRINTDLFVWKLNLKITGCIFDKKKYGWLFFYSQLNDISVLYHLDWLVSKLCKRYNVNNLKIKRFLRAYHEIRNNQHNTKYIINADDYNDLDRRRILANTYKVPINDLKGSEEDIEKMFRKILFKDLSMLEKDVQNFS